jgi:hypothetical protein
MVCYFHSVPFFISVVVMISLCILVGLFSFATSSSFTTSVRNASTHILFVCVKRGSGRTPQQPTDTTGVRLSLIRESIRLDTSREVEQIML